MTPCSPLIGPGVEEDRGEEDQVPGPGSAHVRAAQENPRAASSSRMQQSGEPDLIANSSQTKLENQDSN